MGACLSNGKQAAKQPRKRPSSQPAAPADAAVPATTNRVQFGFATNFMQCYRLEEELGRGQYGITYRYSAATVLMSMLHFESAN
jgi:hypothetical protein